MTLNNPKNIELSVIIPAYNEALRIEATLESIERYFAKKDISHEIIVVDDGSSDNTVPIVRAYARSLPAIKILENEKNCGKGYSVNRGMYEARGRYRLFMDADNSVDISHLDAFLKEMQIGHDIVIGSIRLKNSSISENAGWHRRVLGYCSKVLINILAVPEIGDTQRGFKLFSAEAAGMIFPRQTIHRFGFDIEILVIAWVNGLTVKELPVRWNNPAGSTVTLKAYFGTLLELAKISMNRLMGKYEAVSGRYAMKAQ